MKPIQEKYINTPNNFNQKLAKKKGETALALAKEKEAGKKPLFVKKGVSFEQSKLNRGGKK